MNNLDQSELGRPTLEVGGNDLASHQLSRIVDACEPGGCIVTIDGAAQETGWGCVLS